MYAGLCGGTAIEPAIGETGTGRRPTVDAVECELEEPGFGSTVAVILTACAAMSLAILPSAIALHAPGVPPGWLVGAAGTLAAIVAFGKVAAIAWGAGSRLWGLHRASAAAVYAD